MITKDKVFGFASDHAGFELKEQIKQYVQDKGYSVLDVGTNNLDSVSYATYGQKLAEAIKDKKADYGLSFCGTGLGMSYALNRFEGIRAAKVNNVNESHLSRLHNDANALALSGRFTTFEEAKAIVDEFIKTDYEGGRHQNRIDQLDHFHDSEKCNC